MDGLGYAYAGFAQDDWKITPKLTLNFGFRYELHPPLKEIHYDTAAFDPNYVGDGFTGAVVVPNAQALTYTDADFAALHRANTHPHRSARPSPCKAALHRLRRLRPTCWLRLGDRSQRPSSAAAMDASSSPLSASQLVSGWSVHASFVPYYYNDFEPREWSTPAVLPKSLPHGPLHAGSS